MKRKKQMYILDHYYSIDHEKQCLVIEINKSVEEMIEITSVISFVLEDMIDPSVYLEEEWLLECLEKFYGAENVKDGVEIGYLQGLKMPIEDVFQGVLYRGHHSVTKKGYVIDLYSARESCCGEKYMNIMDRWLPKGKKLEELRALLMARYIESNIGKTGKE